MESRGVEIDSRSPRRCPFVIASRSEIGVAVRMAVLEAL